MLHERNQLTFPGTMAYIRWVSVRLCCTQVIVIHLTSHASFAAATVASFVAFGMALFLRLRSQSDKSGLRFTCIPIVTAIVSCAGVLINDASIVSEHSMDLNGPDEEGMVHSASMGSVVSTLPIHGTLPAY